VYLFLKVLILLSFIILYYLIILFLDDTDTSLKPLSCFDVSCDGRFLVAGTDVLKDDAFLLFWDVRTTKLLGGYWDTHQGDITQVKLSGIFKYLNQ